MGAMTILAGNRILLHRLGGLVLLAILVASLTGWGVRSRTATDQVAARSRKPRAPGPARPAQTPPSTPESPVFAPAFRVFAPRGTG
jgi:hypothetical protein